MRVALPSDLGRLQDSSVPQLHQDLLSVELVGLTIVVRFDATNKVRLACHHLGQQVHQRVLEGVKDELGSLIWGVCDNLDLKKRESHSKVGGDCLRSHVGGFSRVARRVSRFPRLNKQT